MGVNNGIVYVDLPSGVDSEAVIGAIAAYWARHGARVAEPPDALPPTALRVHGGGCLGFLVARRASGVVAILDSEGYTADPKLARALGKALKAPTCAIELAGAFDDAALKAYGKWDEKPAGRATR